jgi:hypothetical protein
MNTRFHLYLLAGQSNMAGRGEVATQDQIVHPRVFAMNKELQWTPAVDPVHFDKSIAGVGPGLTFAKIMAEHDPSIQVGLIPCAVGGSPITAWRPGSRYEPLDVFPYDNAIDRAKRALGKGVLKGILWHQGEGDSTDAEAAHYEGRLTDLVKTFRTDLATDLFFIVGTLADFFTKKNPQGIVVNEALRRLPKLLQRTACVDSSDLEHKGDELHFCAQAARELGRRYAHAMLSAAGQTP